MKTNPLTFAEVSEIRQDENYFCNSNGKGESLGVEKANRAVPTKSSPTAISSFMLVEFLLASLSVHQHR